MTPLQIPILRRRLPKGSGTSLFYVCPWWKPTRFLYLQALSGSELVDYLGPRCRGCAGLRSRRRVGTGRSLPASSRR